MSGEHLISLAKAARELRGGPVHVSTVHRWRLSGVRGIRLETIMCGGRRMTSLAAINRFNERITAVANGDAVPARSDKQREAAIDAAERELDTLGV